MIEVTGIDLVKFVKKVYELSRPLGMGFLQFTPDPLTDEQAKGLISVHKKDPSIKLSLDYVNGRSCKMTVYKETEGKLFNKKEKLFIRDNWYDHTDSQLKELLKDCGVNYQTEGKAHAPACTCDTCERDRAKGVIK